jgi:hypothetical protein
MAAAVSIKDMAVGVVEFVTQAENIHKIATVISGVSASFSILWDIVKQVFNNIIGAIKTIIAPITDLVGGISQANWAFDILAGIASTVSSVFKVASVIIREQIETVIQFGRAVVASFNIISAGFARLKGDLSKEEFQGIARAAGDEWKNVGLEIVENFTEPFKVAIDEGKTFIGRTKEQADEYRKIWAGARAESYAAVSGALSGSAPVTPGFTTIDLGDGGDESNVIDFAAMSEKYKQLDRERLDSKIATLQSQEAWEQELHDANMERIQAELEARQQATATAMGMMADMFSNFADLYDKDTEEGKRAAKMAAVAQKALSVFNTFMSTKEAATKALTAGPIAGPILAGIIGAMGLANMAMIAAKPIPMAEGGIVMPRAGGTLAQIGEAGRPEAVIPLDRMGGLGNITVNVYGSVGSQEDVAVWVYEGISRARQMGKVA